MADIRQYTYVLILKYGCADIRQDTYVLILKYGCADKTKQIQFVLLYVVDPPTPTNIIVWHLACMRHIQCMGYS
jgi:hypothetical protein